ncbi:MAG: hypothetical protein LBM00_04015 [Deltaproteobacteria bacterium]|jgi:hypothetical protein|nr:hypothetical protein [Deltaproteobacteria bacterium]
MGLEKNYQANREREKIFGGLTGGHIRIWAKKMDFLCRVTAWLKGIFLKNSLFT